MSAQERLNKGRRILTALAKDLSYGEQLEALFNVASADRRLLDSLDRTKEAWGFNAVRIGVHQALMMTLSRMHDSGRQSDTVSISNLLIIASAKDVLAARDAELRAEGELAEVGGDPPKDYLDKLRAQQSEVVAEKIKKARQLVEESSAMHAELQELKEYAALRKLRDWVLAHSDISRHSATGTKWGDGRKLLRPSRRILNNLGVVLTGAPVSSHVVRERWRAAAKDYWARLEQGPSAGPAF